MDIKGVLHCVMLVLTSVGDVQVRRLDWCHPFPTATGWLTTAHYWLRAATSFCVAIGTGQFDWSVEDLKILSNIDVIIAADGRLAGSGVCVCVVLRVNCPLCTSCL